ncbi:MAG TPA: L-histidine N(alpha)-methyltransferase [Gammaproteobacteria bacterium]
MNNIVENELELLDFHPASKDMLADVLRGLTAEHKWLSSLYFYDARGSQLFDEICELPEYYPTRTELAIMEANIDEMSELLGLRAMLVEFGSGSSLKTRTLLEHMDDLAAYVPVEISRDHLMQSAQELHRHFPGIEILPVCADFTQDFGLPEPAHPPLRNIVYFPGSTIGNFDPDDALDLLKRMAHIAEPGGGVLIGVDLEKDAATLERAYNDAAGVTARFNLNILERLNRELDGDFNLDAFSHKAVWNEQRHRIEMHLESSEDQVVRIRGHEIRFRAGETIHTESSYKFTLPRFEQLAAQAGLTVKHAWMDEKRLFSVQFLTTSG